MKILVYNYADFAYFFLEVIKFSREEGVDIEWRSLVLSERFFAPYIKTIGKDNTYYIHPWLNELMRKSGVNMDVFRDYPASIYSSLHSDKGEGKLRRMSREYGLKYVFSVYSMYKEILDKERPDCVFFPIIESTDAVILFNLCIEKKIEPVIYCWGRNFGVSFFSNALNGELPPYARNLTVNEEEKGKALEFIQNFRRNFKSPGYVFQDQQSSIKIKNLSVVEKSFKYFRRVLTRKEPHNVSDKGFIGKMMTNSQGFCRFLRKINDILNKRFFDLNSVAQLPDKFVYYPLHLSPESSINVMAPFFTDQLRAIDLILENMPSTYYLLVKEHPNMAGVRSASFYRDLRKRAGVLLADYSLNNVELIERAACTIGVTGTSCLEAFLLGKPSIHLGKEFFTDWIRKLDNFDNFHCVISESINSKEVDLDKIVDLTARVLKIGYDFVLFSPFDPGLESGHLMNRRNIKAFLNALLDHMHKVGKI
jgi:hypothetical protein